jgi:hypothetical protein
MKKKSLKDQNFAEFDRIDLELWVGKHSCDLIQRQAFSLNDHNLPEHEKYQE